MRNFPSRPGLFPLLALFVLACGLSPAGERCDIILENRLDETILIFRTKYSTPYDEPRFSSSRISLLPGATFRIGVQGTTLPEEIIIDLLGKSCVFQDLSGLEPAAYMSLAVERGDGGPVLRRMDVEGEAAGIERNYLTAENRPNAVDKDFVMDVKTRDELDALLRERMAEASERLGGIRRFSLEAGPIWNHEHALERCPEVVREWNAGNGGEARWTGHWRTTVQGEMSECACVDGAADEEGTVFVEDEGWGRNVYYPVFWKEWFGVGCAMEPGDPDWDIANMLRFRLPADGAQAMLGELFEDLRVDGYRPVQFSAEAVNMDDDGDAWEKVLDEDIDFRTEDMDKWDAHDRIVEILGVGYSASDVKGALTWVEDAAFEAAKAGGDVPETRGVVCQFTRDTFEVVFLPDGQMLLEE